VTKNSQLSGRHGKDDPGTAGLGDKKGCPAQLQQGGVFRKKLFNITGNHFRPFKRISGCWRGNFISLWRSVTISVGWSLYCSVTRSVIGHLFKAALGPPPVTDGLFPRQCLPSLHRPFVNHLMSVNYNTRLTTIKIPGLKNQKN